VHGATQRPLQPRCLRCLPDTLSRSTPLAFPRALWQVSPQQHIGLTLPHDFLLSYRISNQPRSVLCFDPRRYLALGAGAIVGAILGSKILFMLAGYLFYRWWKKQPGRDDDDDEKGYVHHVFGEPKYPRRAVISRSRKGKPDFDFSGIISVIFITCCSVRLPCACRSR
jgi:hypothetical protein